MSLVFLPNTAWAGAAQVDITDVSDVSVAADAPNFESMAGGQRNLAFSQAGTAGMRAVYINKAGTLSATHVVLARADLHNNLGYGVDVRSWTNYPSTFVQEYSYPSFSQTLVGKNSQDYIATLSVSGKQALGMSFTSTYAKTIAKMFFATGVTMNYPQEVTTRLLPFPSRFIYRRQCYLTDEEWSFRFEGMTRAEVQAFDTMPNLLSEPMFVYDSSGIQIPYKLLHGIIVEKRIVNADNDLHNLFVKMDTLRQWA